MYKKLALILFIACIALSTVALLADAGIHAVLFLLYANLFDRWSSEGR